MKLRRWIGLAALALACATPALGQGDPTTGVREPAVLLHQLPSATIAGLVDKQTHFLLLPGIVGANGATIYGSDAGIIRKFNPSVALQVRAGVGSMDLGPESKIRFGGEAKLGRGTARTALSARAAHTKVTDLSDRTEFTAAGEGQLFADKNKANRIFVGLTANHVTVKPNGAPSVDGLTFAPGLIWKTGSTTEIRSDYVLDNDVDGEDSFSFAVVQALNSVPGAPTLILAAAKHRTIVARLLYIR